VGGFDPVASFQPALRYNTTGSKNTGVGSGALSLNTTASHNTTVGYGSLYRATTGDRNTCMGTYAGGQLTTGGANVVIGYLAGDHSTDLITGGDNVLVGSYTRTSDTNSVGVNVFGYDVEGADGYTTIGNATNDIRAVHGTATWSTVSDERYKKDIVDSEAGLSLINALRPRTFNYKTLGELPETFRAYEEGSTEVFKSDKTQHGFIAQEVKTAIDADSSIKDGFKLWDDRPDGSQEVAETALIPMLVKAIQELSAKVTTLESENTAIKARLDALEAE
jgi:hypothetical protein